ncbi:MAG: SocA family protein [bacterium]|nr:SocA family protein [bacterium]
MTSVHDVAAYILKQSGLMTAMKLQKLVYYSQAWALVWDEKPVFSEEIQAWANGPVVPDLYDRHRGRFEVDAWSSGDPEILEDWQRETVNAVLDFYGPKSSQWLSNLTHREDPWRDAREGLAPGERGARVITLAAMAEYYGGLTEG